MLKKWFSGLIIGLIFLTISASEWYPARVEMSGGDVLDGEIAMTGSRPLVINTDPDQRTVNRRVQFDDLLMISQIVEQRSVEKPWLYTESGKKDKTFLPGEYCFLNFKTELSLVTGEILRGHIISMPLRFRTPDGSGKLFLGRQVKGKVATKAVEPEYISRITFLNHKPVGSGKISGTVKGCAELQECWAIDRKRGIMVSGKTQNDSYTFTNLLPGDYDIFLLTETEVMAGFIGTTDIPPQLAKVFPLADDFFRERWILALDDKRSLVYKRRADFYQANRHVKGGFIWHLEVWNWHCADDDWKLDRRNLVLRHKQTAAESNRRLLLVEKLCKVKPDEQREIDINLDGSLVRILE